MTSEPPERTTAGRMSLLDHLEELRRRLLIVLLTLLVLTIPGYFLAQPFINWLQQLACPADISLYYLQPMALFFLRLKVGLVIALLLASPLIAYQIWCFITPALHPPEAHMITRLVWVSTTLFISGTLCALLLVFPLLMQFAYGMGTTSIQPMMQVDSVIEIALALALGFGLIFQLPILLFFLVLFRLVSVATIRRQRPYIVVAIFFFGALLTPPDIISQLCMTLPAWLLYETTILLLSRKTAKQQEGGK